MQGTDSSGSTFWKDHSTACMLEKKIFKMFYSEIFVHFGLNCVTSTAVNDCKPCSMSSFPCFFPRRSKYSKAKQDSDEEKHLHQGNLKPRVHCNCKLDEKKKQPPLRWVGWRAKQTANKGDEAKNTILL